MKWKPTQFLHSNGNRYGVPTYDKVVASAGNYDLWVEKGVVKENPFITVDNKFLTEETFTSSSDAELDGKIKDDVPAYRISRKGGHAGDVMGSKLITVDATKPTMLLNLVDDANEQTKKAYKYDPDEYNGKLVELSPQQAKMIAKVIQYAFKQQPADAVSGQNYFYGQAHFLATQVIIWEIF